MFNLKARAHNLDPLSWAGFPFTRDSPPGQYGADWMFQAKIKTKIRRNIYFYPHNSETMPYYLPIIRLVL